MKNPLTACTVVLVLAAVALSCARPAPQVAEKSPAPDMTLAAGDLSAYIPGFQDADVKTLAAKPQAQVLFEAARTAAKDADMPVTTYTQYRGFKEKGERESYQRPYYQKRSLLANEVIAVWLGGETQRMSRINDLIWNICEETTWVVPAHEKDASYIDLFSAETGATLAHADRLLGDRLPAEIRDRIRREVKARILDPYLAHGREYGWNSGRNNWTGVCAGSVGEAFLLLETDPERRAQALSLVVEQLGRFIEAAFESDGASLEGMGYWNYGLSHCVVFGEMLRAYSGGKVDLLASPKMKAIAAFPAAVSLGNHLYASFSDAHEHGTVEGFLAAKLAERTGETSLLGLASPEDSWRIGNVVCDVLWWDGKEASAPLRKDVLLPVSGLARLTGTLGGKPLTLAAKAGNNGEPHNHNDVGSFIVCVDETVYLCDPGGGLYNRDYFSKKRYENVFANSYGHSVPRIGGKLQLEGAAFRGTMESAGEKSVRIAFSEAYAEPALKEAVRTLSVQPDSVVLEDRFSFEGPGQAVEEAFVTWQQVEIQGSLVRVLTEKGVLEIRAEAGVFAAEPLEAACRANHKSGMLTRLTVTYPAASKAAARFTMAFKPAP